MPITAQSIRDISLTVGWGKSYLWDIRFPMNNEIPPSSVSKYNMPPQPPSIFGLWFPAHSVQEPVFSVATHPIRTAIFDFNIPKSVAYSDITISFYDTEFDLLKEWLWEWVMHMFSRVYGGQGGLSTRTLVECLRPLEIAKLNNQRNVSYTKYYWVYPSGQLIAFLNSDSGPKDYTLTFSIVGGMFTRGIAR